MKPTEYKYTLLRQVMSNIPGYSVSSLASKFGKVPKIKSEYPESFRLIIADVVPEWADRNVLTWSNVLYS